MVSMPASQLTNIDVRYTRRENEQLANFSTPVITNQLIYNDGYKKKHERCRICNI